MYLWFTSDYSVQYIGFNIKYVSTGTEIDGNILYLIHQKLVSIVCMNGVWNDHP